MEWRDDFNGFDHSRWEAADHSGGFDQNLSTYLAEQVFIEDG